MIQRYAPVSTLLLLATAFLHTAALADQPPAARLQMAPVQIAQAESELDFWNAIKDSKKAEDYQAYLDKFPNGNFVDLAKLRPVQLPDGADHRARRQGRRCSAAMTRPHGRGGCGIVPGRLGHLGFHSTWLPMS